MTCQVLAEHSACHALQAISKTHPGVVRVRRARPADLRRTWQPPTVESAAGGTCHPARAALIARPVLTATFRTRLTPFALCATWDTSRTLHSCASSVHQACTRISRDRALVSGAVQVAQQGTPVQWSVPFASRASSPTPLALSVVNSALRDTFPLWGMPPVLSAAPGSSVIREHQFVQVARPMSTRMQRQVSAATVRWEPTRWVTRPRARPVRSSLVTDASCHHFLFHIQRRLLRHLRVHPALQQSQHLGKVSACSTWMTR